MSKGHFSYFRVQNFKRFKDLEVDTIGQFNLILGDNNVGKTSLLEALLWDKNFATYENRLHEILRIKNFKLNRSSTVFKYFLNCELEAQLNESKLVTYFSNSSFPDQIHQIEYLFDFDALQVKLSSPTIKTQKVADLGKGVSGRLPFIPFSYGYANDLVENYSSFVQKNRGIKHALIKELKRIDVRIDDIEIDISNFEQKPSLIVYFNDQNESIPLGMLGDGIVKLFRIFIEIIISKEKILLIDEIDTGIHFSRMKDFWNIVLASAIENNVQIFATTHNRECIEAYEHALRELGQKSMSKARIISLKEMPDSKNVTAFTSGFEVLESAIALGNDLR